MSTLEIPNPETIAKFTRAGSFVRPVEKNGAAVETETATGVYSQWMDITPAMAAEWLKNNFRNRPVADDVVSAYARDMINGVWMPTHQGIGFNDRDELIDGQHRLMAIIRANKTIRMMVTFGLASKIENSLMTTMDCVDRGRTRSVPDQLKIQHGLKHGTQIAQIASAIAGLCFERVRRLSVGQTLEIYREFKDGMDHVIEKRSKASGLKSAGVLGAFAFVLQTDPNCFNDGGSVMQMFDALNSGEGLEEFPNVKLLREFLTGEQASLLLASMNRGVAELTVQVIFLELKHQRLEKLELALDGVLHYREQLKDEVAKIAAMFALPKLAPAVPAATITEAVPETAAPAVPQAPAAPATPRPTLERIFNKVESYFKISAFIITGRGADPDINASRVVFIHLARGFGYTENQVAIALKKTEDYVREHQTPLNAMTAKQHKAVEAIKPKL